MTRASSVMAPGLPIQSRVLNHLRQVRGRVVSMGELVDHCYADREDGGPLFACKIVGLAILCLRQRGFPIATVTGRGFRFAPTFWQVQAPEKAA